jgi:hypothetical protein
VNTNSALFECSRSGTWTVRRVFDLAESANTGLGDRACRISEKELGKALEDCEPIVYSVENRGDVCYIGIGKGGSSGW